ncbi:hypothetical protein MKX01_017773, partial [Papaver californicum]
MNTSLPLNLLLLLVFAHFSCFLVLVPVSAKVFLSIDCGSSSLKPHTDNNSIVWVGNGPYIQIGEVHKVNAPMDIPGFDSNVMSTVRAFPPRKKNYIDNKSEDNTTVGRVLVRANFYYGNYDKKSSPSTFNLQFNGNHWDKIVTVNNSIAFYEVLSKFCSTWKTCYVPSDYPMIFIDRIAFGTNGVTRYPEDSFDRIWSWIGPLSNANTLTRVRSNSPSINITTEDKPPETVLRTALMRSNSYEDLFYFPTINRTVPIHFNAYFSEVIKLNSTQKRLLEVSI